jgi:hypothetical protein
MSEASELKREIRWLQDRAREADGLGEAVADIQSRLYEIERVLNNHSEKLRELSNNFIDLGDAMVRLIEVLRHEPSPSATAYDKAASKAKAKPKQPQATFTIEHNVPMPEADHKVKKKRRGKRGGSTTTDYWTIARPSKT